MARDWKQNVKTGKLGEDLGRDPGPEPEELCNRFYNRKQRTKANDVTTDCEAEFAPEDRDAEYANYKSGRDESFYNYKKWDRYGR